jgi:hypothetical protein
VQLHSVSVVSPPPGVFRIPTRHPGWVRRLLGGVPSVLAWIDRAHTDLAGFQGRQYLVLPGYLAVGSPALILSYGAAVSLPVFCLGIFSEFFFRG